MSTQTVEQTFEHTCRWCGLRFTSPKRRHRHCSPSCASRTAAANRPRRPVAERLEDKFTEGPDCWEWTGAKSKGSGRIGMPGRSPLSAARAVYELRVGPIPDGLELANVCGNRGCVRPDHHQPMTRSENAKRAVANRPKPEPERRWW